MDEAEQGLQGVVEIAAILLALGGERDQLQFAQGFEAVAAVIDGVADGSVAQLRAGLDVEQEQQAVHVAQAFDGELFRVEFVLAAEDAFLSLARLGDELAGGFVAEQLDGLAQRVFEVFGDAIGVLVGVLVEGVEQRLALVGEHAGAVQQDADGFQGVGFAAAEQLQPVEAQQAALGELGAVEQQPLAGADQQHPARRMGLAVDGAGDEVLPVLALERLGDGGSAEAAQLLVVDGERQRVGVLLVAGEGFDDPQQWLLLAVADFGEQRQFDVVIERKALRLAVEAENGQQLFQPVALQVEAGGGGFFLFQLLEGLQPGLRE